MSTTDTPRERTTGNGGLRLMWSAGRLGTSSGISPDSQIARALHHAQVGAGADARPKTLDEILAMAERVGWTQVFKQLKAQGLVAEQTLGQVVARWSPRNGRSHPAAVLPATVLLEAGLPAASSHAPNRTAS